MTNRHPTFAVQGLESLRQLPEPKKDLQALLFVEVLPFLLYI